MSLVSESILSEKKMFTIVCAAAVGAAASSWWEHGEAPYPLQVPTDLAVTAKPIWAGPSGCTPGGRLPQLLPQFVLARTEFVVANNRTTLKHAVVFVTAQQSPYCQPDPRLVDNNYGSCLDGGGTSQAKLLGAYKLFVNGRLVGMGPGRRVNQTQGVDAIDITSVLHTPTINERHHRQGESGSANTTTNPALNAIGLQGFHTARFVGDHPRLLLQLVLTYTDGAVQKVSTGDAGWETLNADSIFNPTSSTGAWAGGSCSGVELGLFVLIALFL
jgi:hypothetical protein